MESATTQVWAEMVALGVATGRINAPSMDEYTDPDGYRLEGLVVRVLHDHFAGAMG